MSLCFWLWGSRFVVFSLPLDKFWISIVERKHCCKLFYMTKKRTQHQRHDAHSEPLIQKLGWPAIKQLIESEIAKVMHKALLNEAPDYIKGLFIGCLMLKVGCYAMPILIFAFLCSKRPQDRKALNQDEQRFGGKKSKHIFDFQVQIMKSVLTITP